MSRTFFRCAFVLCLLAVLSELSSAHVARTRAEPSAISSQSAPLDIPPHIGYGMNVWNNLDLAQPLGLDWVKIYEDNPSIFL